MPPRMIPSGVWLMKVLVLVVILSVLAYFVMPTIWEAVILHR
jgi:Tfp pilus assembly protein FimT